MAFKVGAFLSGFATKAQEIEEESAKIGRELIKEALDDFRAEAKNYNKEADQETREYIELAKVLRPMLKDDNKVTAVLDKGKTFAQLFIRDAENTAKKKGYDSVADLVRVSDSFEGVIDPIQWIRSGAPINITAPTYVGPDEMRTPVFNRKVSAGEGQAREGIEKAYIRTPTDSLVAPTAEIEISAVEDLSKLQYSPPSRTDDKQYRAAFEEALGRASGFDVSYDTDGLGGVIVKLQGAKQEDKMRITKDAEDLYQTWLANAKAQDKALDPTTILGDAMGYAASQYSQQDPFYKYATRFMSTMRQEGDETRGTEIGSVDTSKTPDTTSKDTPVVPQGDIPQNPADHYIIKQQIKSESNTRSKISVISGVLQRDYGMTKEDADLTAKGMIGQ